MNSTGETPVTAAVRHWRLCHWPTVTLVLMAAILAVMAVLASQEPSFGWDRAIAAWLLGFSTPAYDAFMEAVSFPGNRTGVWVTMLAGAALAAWRLGWRAGLLVLVGLALMGANEVFKDVVDRPRPLEPVSGGGESFPSGHTLHAVLTSGLLWLLVMPRLTQATHRRMMLAVLLVWPVLVGISRVHLERHWPSDVLGAYVFGAALLIVIAWVWPKVAPVRPRIEYGAGSGPVDTVRPEPTQAVRSEPSQPVRPEPVEGLASQQGDAPSGPVDTVRPEPPSQPVRPEPVEGLAPQQGDAP